MFFFFWGEDLFAFYNDAYRPKSKEYDGKHPAIGKKGKEVWPEDMEFYLAPLINQCSSTSGLTCFQ